MRINQRTQPRNLAHNRQPRRPNPRSFAFWRRLCLCWFLSLTLVSLPAMPPAARAEVRTAPAAKPAAPAPAAAPQSNVDLTITALDTSALVTDSQTLILSGTLGATIKNLGSAATNGQFRVIAFEDRNANGQFNAGTDALLGSINVADSIAAGASANLSLALGGTVTFKGNLIYVFVDSENAIAETNENNNTRNTGGFGDSVLPTGQLNPVLKWKKDVFTVQPQSNQVMMTPAVIDLNGDGIPDIVFSTFAFPRSGGSGVGYLRAISGAGGQELWTVNNSAYLVEGYAGVTVGDIDNDGRPEILATRESGQLMAFEHDGTFKWQSSVNFGGSNWASASLADLEHDGTPEIIFGATVLNNNGSLRWQGNQVFVGGAGPLSCVADLDLDGNPEIVMGRTAYRADGAVYWNASIPDGHPAIGNFDNDAFPEVVVVAGGNVYLLEHNGQLKWGPVAIPGGGFGGAPTVADFDNDGQPEIGVAGASRYVVFETNGSVKWQAQTQDGSSSQTGSSVFDFEGDGSAEAIYGDELFLRIYRGTDGTELFKLPKGSGTTYELPVIADVDADGHAEIIAAANNYAFGSQNGIYVIGGADNNWINTRRIWNQHTYHITNVNEDGTIPRNEQPNWLTPGLNNFRLNTFAPGDSGSVGKPDLTASLIRKNDDAFPNSSELTARIGNGGGTSVPTGVKVSFYRGDPAAGGTLIGTTQTTIALNPGQYEDVKVVWNNPPTGLHPITVVADDNGSGQGTVAESNEANNKAMANIALGIGPFTLVDDLIARFKDGAVDLKWSPIAGATGYNVYRRTGNGAPQLIKQNHPRANFADSALTNGTTYYYTVRWVNANGIESGDGTEMSATPTAQSNRNDVPPTILSAPVTRTVANAPYSYDVNARDPNAADTLAYALPTPAPEALRGMTVNPASGLIQWTSGFANAGYQNVTVRVADSRGRFATQTYRLFVEIPNSPPLVNAGPDQTIMATETANLLGTVLDDGLPFGGTLTTSWTKVSGPGTVTFANPGQPQTTATFSAQGTYVLRLAASDSALSGSDDVTINVVRPFASRLYTLNADFDQGNLNNVDHRIPHQLQLGNQAQPFNFIWVAVSSKGTAVKINTETGQILGEYYTSPDGQPKNPSRTTVDLNGNVWMTNRDGNSVTRIGLVENGQCIDRNGNGRIDTSTGQNDIKVWTNTGGADTNGGASTAQDECIINYVRVSSSGTRHLSVDRNNDVWVSGHESANPGIFNLIDSITGAIKRTEGPVGFGGYGGLIDKNGVIWSAGWSNLLRWDTSKPLTGPNGGNWTGYDGGSAQYYGMCIDTTGNVWSTSYYEGKIRKFSPNGTLLDTYNTGSTTARGCAIDRNNHVWIAHTDTSVTGHLKSDGTLVGTISVGSGPTGVAVDPNGKIWTANLISGTVSRIDPNAGPIGADGVTRVGAVDFTSVNLGGNPYNYSDMTGSTLPGAPNTGTWTVVFDSQIANAEWGRIGWNAQVCGDGALTVTAASSTDNTTFSAAQNVTRGQDLTVPNGRYLRISVLFRRATTGESPILYDLSVGTEGYAPPAQTNAAPTVDAGADLTTALFIPVKLKGAACDDGLPNGTLSFTWSKVSGPGTVAFANANALATTATINTPGAYVLRLTASDGSSTVSDEINVTIEGTNSPPIITSTAPTSTCSTRPYSYQVIATDPNFGDVLTYSLPTAPAGMTINSATGLIQWTPTAAQAGSNNVKVRVTDLGNNQVEQSFTVTVAATPATNTAPAITSTAPTAGVVGLLYAYQAAATDPDPCETLTWSLDVAPAGMTINPTTGLIQWTPGAAQTGNQNVTVRVRDFSGASATQSFTINVGPPDNTPPVVAIASPAAGATLSADVPVIGSVSDANLQSWTLEYQVSGGSHWVTLATGTTPVNNATLATFPATLLANNAYTLRLRASDPLNQNETFREVIVNSGDLKLGPFTLAYEDLRLPFAGVPIVLRRFYDSRRVESGDFGPGWTLGFSNVDIRTDANLNVFITLPNGRRTAFAFLPQQIAPWFIGSVPRYVAPPGVYDSLENTDCNLLLRSGGQWFCFDTPYNPQNYILRTKEGLTYTLNASGGIRKIEDRNGRFIEITPNGVTTSTGRNVVFTRNAAGRITQITDPSNNTLRYNYDAQSRLVKFTDQLNLATNYSYYGSGQYIQDVLTPGGCRPLRTEYGADGRVSAKVDNAGNRTTHSYDQANRTEAVTDSLGKTTVYKYDERGNLIDALNPLGTRATYVYDASNNLLSITYPSGRKIEQTFSAQGNLLTLSKRAPGGAALTDTYTYTSLNQVASITKPQGDRVVFQYDAKGNLTRRESQDAANNVLQAENYAYDNQGNLTGSTDGAGKTTTFTYNSFGELTRQQDPTGIAASFEYNANGNINARIDGLGNRTEYEYNGFGLLTAVRHGGQVISQTAYNDLGNPAAITDAMGRTTTLSYDCQGNLTQVTDAAGKITRYQVDALSNLKKVTNANNRVTDYQHDGVERQTSRTGPDGGVWGVGYEADGYVASTTLPSGATVQSEYDGFGRLLRETRPEKTIEYTYADCCRLTQIDERIGANTRRTTMSYDGIGRITGVNDPQNRAINYSYNARGQRATMTTPDGLVTNYSYDDAGRLTEVRTGADWVRFTYDAAGRRNQSLYRNGASNSYTYNSRGMLTGVVIRDAANAVIASYNYTRNLNGHVAAVAYHDGSASYTLDALNRITGETVTSTSLGNFSRTYGYDDVGNRLDTGATFGTDNRLLTDAGGSYSYNQNGSLIARGAKSFNYDSTNHLISFNNTGVAASYEYDFLDRRAAKTVNAIRREFLYDGPKLAAEYVGGAQVARYTYGLGTDEPLMVVRGGQTYFYHADGLGSVVAITSGNGQAVQRYGYDAFGNLRLNSGSFTFDGVGLVNTLTYTGREYDSESGLYHYRARAYDAAIGRFLQKDRQQGNLAMPQSQHLYTYALNNPVNFKDPTGEFAVVSYALIIDGYQNQLAAAIIGYVQGIGLPGLIFLGEFLGLADSPLDTGTIWDQALKRTEDKLKDIYKQLGIAGEIGDCASGFLDDLPTKTVKAFASGTDFKIVEVKFKIEIDLGELGNSIADCLLIGSDVSRTLYEKTIVDISIQEGGFKRGTAVGIAFLKSLRPR